MSPVTAILGDSREKLAELEANSIDAVVTDPPYGLEFMGKDWDAPWKEGVGGLSSARFNVKRFKDGSTASLPSFIGGTNPTCRNCGGLRSGSDKKKGQPPCRCGSPKFDNVILPRMRAFQSWCEEWASQVLRVLKPGGHLLAFGGTRTYHRLTCAIEDAGFEVRDAVMWHYGSGFPKSRDVAKDIDKRGGADIGWFGPWFRKWREERSITQKQVAALFPSKSGGLTGCVANWELGFNLPTPEQFNLIRDAYGLPFESIEEAEREVIGHQRQGKLAVAPGQGEDRSAIDLDITAPATDAAKQWEGWGTALKPSTEIICLARKPLSESTVAANVLRWGTGALNIDGCRVPLDPATETDKRVGTDYVLGEKQGIKSRGHWGNASNEGLTLFKPAGRWPANLIHDGSEEVLAGFPETVSGSGDKHGRKPSSFCASTEWERFSGTSIGGDSGSAARFFYTAKADSDDRLGSRHPTVKPVDLIAYLCRLSCPKGGLVLDPFAGSGTTGEACIREGMRAILIEREPQYFEDIQRRMALALAGPEERQRAIIKAQGKAESVEGLPLFSGAAE